VPEAEKPESLGRYQIVRELGRGAMGIVYEGKDPVIGRRVAIKTARRDIMAKTGRADEMMARFLREAGAAGTLNHPNIITIYDAAEEDGIAYIAMEYIESGTLRDLITANRRMDPQQVARIGAQVCAALAAAHEQGIIHRDVKPANIMILPDGSAKVADFGIAHVSDSTLTQEGSMIGTPHFMSPEQFMGHKLDGRSDLFSAGVIVYEMLTGEKPFEGEALSTVMHKVLKVEPIPPKELNFGVEDLLSQVVMKAMSKSPAKRYQTGTAMAAALLESVKEQPDAAVLGLESADSDLAKTVLVDRDKTTIASASPPEATVVSGTAAAEVSESSPPPRPRELGTTRPLRGAPAAQRRRRLAFLATLGLCALALVVAAVTVVGNRNSGAATEDEPTVDKVSVMLWFADTEEAWKLASEATITDPGERYGLCLGEAPATVRIEDADSGELLGIGRDVTGTAVIDLDPPSSMIDVIVTSDGYETGSRSLSAKAVKEMKVVNIPLKNKSMSSVSGNT